jgi:hypothetical protein
LYKTSEEALSNRRLEKGGELRETQNSEDKNERKMYASIYEMNGTIIGGFGSLEGWTPGYFALADKERLIRDGIMKP